MWVLLGAGHTHAPHTLSRRVQLLVHREHASVVRRYRVTLIHRYVVRLSTKHWRCSTVVVVCHVIEDALINVMVRRLPTTLQTLTPTLV